MLNTNDTLVRIDLTASTPVKGSEVRVGNIPHSVLISPDGKTAFVSNEAGRIAVALYHANAIGVVDLNGGGHNTLLGMIPVGYAPSSVVLDAASHTLVVANDKGIGTTGFAVAPSPTNTAENSYGKAQGVISFNTHQDLGTVSLVPVPSVSELGVYTQQVFTNNHWDLAGNIFAASGGKKNAKPLAIPERIGAPSKIKHVFVSIRENRTYDQILGDVVGGNGDPTLAVFGDNPTFGQVTPNAHALMQRFPLFDNFYDPSRQSADGHNWIVQAMAPYSDDIQSPDWLRDYPSNGGDTLLTRRLGICGTLRSSRASRSRISGSISNTTPSGRPPDPPKSRSGLTSITTPWLTRPARKRSSTTSTPSRRTRRLPKRRSGRGRSH